MNIFETPPFLSTPGKPAVNPRLLSRGSCCSSDFYVVYGDFGLLSSFVCNNGFVAFSCKSWFLSLSLLCHVFVDFFLSWFCRFLFD